MLFLFHSCGDGGSQNAVNWPGSPLHSFLSSYHCASLGVRFAQPSEASLFVNFLLFPLYFATQGNLLTLVSVRRGVRVLPALLEASLSESLLHADSGTGKRKARCVSSVGFFFFGGGRGEWGVGLGQLTEVRREKELLKLCIENPE